MSHRAVSQMADAWNASVPTAQEALAGRQTLSAPWCVLQLLTDVLAVLAACLLNMHISNCPLVMIAAMLGYRSGLRLPVATSFILTVLNFFLERSCIL
jgi:hypothetical protein